jgi:molybdenum cofactor synthesis domain-containing protein
MDDRREMRELVSLSAARATLADLDVGGGVERVPIAEADGRTLAAPVEADVDVPGFDRARVDGYAVRATDTVGADGTDPARLRVVARVDAGQRPPDGPGPDEAIEVATGAVLPDGADAVVMVEDTDERAAVDPDAGDVGPEVLVRTALAPGENVTPAGADLAAGDRVLSAGTVLGPRTVAPLAALGRDRVAVRRRPRVAVVSTGEELRQPGADLDPGAGEVYDVNTATLATAVRAAGGRPRRYDDVPDDRRAMRATLRAAADECDLVLTSGSTSAGAGDLLYRVVDEVGDLLVHGVAIKPGKPTVVGRVEGTAYVGLPGYPVSALSVFRLLVAPRLRAATGVPGDEATVEARLVVAERSPEGRDRALPVGLVEAEGDLLAYPVDRGSGATTSLAAADGVVAVDADVREVPAGTAVEVDTFATDPRPPDLLAVGESDPVAARLLDRAGRTRYLPWGPRAGERWRREGVADVAVLVGESGDPADRLATWRREWGLAVADGVDVDGLAALRDREDLVVAGVGPEVGLQAAVDAAGGLPADVETAGVESAPRRVADGRADAGVALRATAERLDLAFLPVGHQRVSLVVAPERRSKAGVRAVADADLAEAVDGLAGYRA